MTVTLYYIRITGKCINEMHRMRPARAQVYACLFVFIAIYKIRVAMLKSKNVYE